MRALGHAMRWIAIILAVCFMIIGFLHAVAVARSVIAAHIAREAADLLDEYTFEGFQYHIWTNEMVLFVRDQSIDSDGLLVEREIARIPLPAELVLLPYVIRDASSWNGGVLLAHDIGPDDDWRGFYVADEPDMDWLNHQPGGIWYHKIAANVYEIYCGRGVDHFPVDS